MNNSETINTYIFKTPMAEAERVKITKSLDEYQFPVAAKVRKECSKEDLVQSLFDSMGWDWCIGKHGLQAHECKLQSIDQNMLPNTFSIGIYLDAEGVSTYANGFWVCINASPNDDGEPLVSLLVDELSLSDLEWLVSLGLS